MNGKDSALMSRKQVVDKIADDRVWFVAKLRHHPADQRAAAAVPLQIDSAMQIAGAMNFGPAVGAPGLFGPNFDEPELSLQLGITHDF